MKKLKTIYIIGLSLFNVSYWIFSKGNEFANTKKTNDDFKDDTFIIHIKLKSE
ncbi:MAG: hypothetical protein ACJA2M_000848 [Polaribacter sp.]|jgi:hypothetical protein